MRQLYWRSRGFLKHSTFGLRLRVRARRLECSVRAGLVAGGDLFHLGEIFLDAGLLEAGFDEVLVGADEDSGTAFDGGAEGGEVAAGLRGEEEDGLLGAGGDGDGDALFADFFFPGFDADEPVVRRGVGGAAEEGGDEEIFNGLGGRQVGMEPELVAGEEVGDGGDGERDAIAGDVDVDLGAGEVKAGLGTGGRGREEEDETGSEAEEQMQRGRRSARELGHVISLDVRAGRESPAGMVVAVLRGEC